MLVLMALLLQSLVQPRVFVTESASWQIEGAIASTAGAVRGGARPQTAEIIKTLQATCRSVLVTADKDRADYVLLMEHEGGKGHARKDNKWVLFTRDGDALGSGSTRTLGNAVKNACTTLAAHANAR